MMQVSASALVTQGHSNGQIGASDYLTALLKEEQSVSQQHRLEWIPQQLRRPKLVDPVDQSDVLGCKV